MPSCICSGSAVFRQADRLGSFAEHDLPRPNLGLIGRDRLAPRGAARRAPPNSNSGGSRRPADGIVEAVHGDGEAG